MSKLSDRRKEVADMNVLDVQKQVQELRLKLFNLRLQQQRGEVKNSRVFSQTRKDIARLQHRLTILENEQDDTAI